MERLVFVFTLIAILNVKDTQAATPGVKSCVVETTAGFVDLSLLGNQDDTPRFDDYSEADVNYTYSWNPCYSFDESSFCKGVELCQHDVIRDYNLGSDATAEFLDNGTSLFLVYTAEDYVVRKSYVQLVCDEEEEGVFSVEGEEPETFYHFSVRSKYACPTHETPTTRGWTTAARTTAVIVPTTPSPPTPSIFSLKTITILLGCILVSLCLLICQVFLGLITRRSGREEREEELPPYEEKKRKF